MAKRPTKDGKPVIRTTDKRITKPVRLELSPADHKRLEKTARELGLTMASYARLALFERLKADAGGAK
jgi:hypothetical protein